MNFKLLPKKYLSMINSINDVHIKNVYNQFDFAYLHINEINLISNENEIKKGLLNYFSDINLVSYIFTNQIKVKLSDSNEPESIICFEKKCIVIKGASFSFIQQILLETKSYLIDISDNNVKKEIEAFYRYFKKEINNNVFVQCTIIPIAGFLIRRFFFNSCLFDDPSFFNYKNKCYNTFGNELKHRFIKLLTTKPINEIESIQFNDLFKTENKDKSDIQCIESFQEKEFIKLRDIYRKTSIFYLVIHIETLHVFIMKKFLKKKFDSDQKHEIEFCQNYSNQFFTPFYGFLKKKEEIIGLIYEFMSNDSLSTYLNNNNKTEEDDLRFSLMATYRVSQGIEFLHSNSLIHRDLNPKNILVNHDGIPFISDFETIIKINSDKDKSNNETFDIGYNHYVSPEVFKGIKYSYPTDIYSFGLIIYFLHEKKNPDNIQIYGNSEIISKITKCPRFIEQIYESSVKYNQNERLTIHQINKIIYNHIISFEHLKEFLKDKQDKRSINTAIQYICENLCFLKQYLSLKEIEEYFFSCYRILIDHLLTIDKYKSYALNNLGNIHFAGFGTEQNYEEARKNYELSAKLNNSYGLFNLGYLYCYGYGVHKNYSKAMDYYEKSAELNNSSAFNGIGYLYKTGKGVKRNYSTAINYFYMAAEQKNPNALYNLGYLYFEGHGVKQDFSKAKEYFLEAAKYNNSCAYNALGFMHEFGFGVEINYLKSKEYYEKGIRLNNTNSIVNLAVLYRDGNLGKPDYPKAMYLLNKAAQKNNPDAFFHIGKMYEEGLGVNQNYQEAMNYYELAAKFDQINANLYIGNMYFYGKGVKQNYQTAYNYYELSTKQENPESFFMLGLIHEKGYGVVKDYLRAKDYYELASEYGNYSSFYKLGRLFIDGDYFDVDFEKSYEYFMKCIETKKERIFFEKNGNYEFVYNYKYYPANNEIALYYLLSKNDEKIAKKYFIEAVSGEYPPAQSNFGIFCQFNSKDMNRAEYFFRKASKNKFVLAEYNLGSLIENKDGIETAIKFYIDASKHENEQLQFRNNTIVEDQLLFSTSFILILTNLILVHYYLNKNDEKNVKFYLNKLINILQRIDKNKTIHNENCEDLISHIKDLIVNLLFSNDKKINSMQSQNSGKFQSIEFKLEPKNINENAKRNNSNTKKFKFSKTIDNDVKISNNLSTQIIDSIFKKIEDNKYFINQVSEIIHVIKSILYEPPYLILYARSQNIKIKNDQKVEALDSKKTVNDAFYKGLEIEV